MLVSTLRDSLDSLSWQSRRCASPTANQRKDYPALRSPGLALALRGNCAGSHQILSRRVSLHPEDEMAWLWVGDTSLLLGKTEAAKTAWTRAHASPLLAKRGELALSSGKRSQAREWLLRALEIETDAKRAVAIATKLGNLGQSRGVAHKLERLIEPASPSTAGFWLVRGAQAELEGYWDAAAQQYSKGLRISPNDLALLKRAKRVYDRLQDWEKAYSINERILTQLYSGWWLLEQARYAAKMGKFEQAEAFIARASQLRDQPDWRILWARAQVSCAAGNSAEAMRFFSRALSAQPRNWQLYYARGLCHSSLGNLDQAIADLRTAVEIGPGSRIGRGLLLDLARLLESQGRIDEAAATYNSLLRLSPADPVATDRLERLRRANHSRPAG